MKVVEYLKHATGYGRLVRRIGPRNALCVVTSGALILFMTAYVYQTMGGGFGWGFEGFTDAATDGKKQAELMLFYADWCPACRKFKPTWYETKEAADKKTIGGYNVIFTDVNCTNKDDSAVTEKCKKFGVSAYPSIILLKDGQKTVFSGQRTKDGLMSFLQSNLG